MYLRIKQVTALTGLSRATIYSMMASGTFPMKTALGVRAVGWLSSEIQIWMTHRKSVEKQGREAKPAGRKGVAKPHVQANAPGIRVRPPSKLDTDTTNQALHLIEPDTGHTSIPDGQSVSDRLRLINAMKRQKGVPVKRKSQSISIFAHLKRPGAMEKSRDRPQIAPAKASPKTKK
jgi:prophage regulatory protein